MLIQKTLLFLLITFSTLSFAASDRKLAKYDCTIFYGENVNDRTVSRSYKAVVTTTENDSQNIVLTTDDLTPLFETEDETALSIATTENPLTISFSSLLSSREHDGSFNVEVVGPAIDNNDTLVQLKSRDSVNFYNQEVRVNSTLSTNHGKNKTQYFVNLKCKVTAF